MDGFTIAKIDPESSIVYVTYQYSDHFLSDRLLIDSITDSNAIIDLCTQGFNKFKDDIDGRITIPVLSADVSALVGATFNVDPKTGIALQVQDQVDPSDTVNPS